MEGEQGATRLAIAIDGPSGVGKSTLAHRLALRLGLRYVDTGAMYRAVALRARERGLNLEDPSALASLAEGMEIEYVLRDAETRVHVDGRDVTGELRRPGVGEDASKLSRFEAVRRVLTEKQRACARAGRVVMEGRDIGTVVLPDADLKVFLDADPEERARRRQRQWREKGIEASVEELAREIRSRDARDEGREVAPLMAARDAVRIDTTRVDADGVLERILSELARRRITRTG